LFESGMLIAGVCFWIFSWVGEMASSCWGIVSWP
jgi:hypothetical protein